MAQLLRRPGNNYHELPDSDTTLAAEVIRQVEIEIKYAGYIKRERERIEAFRKHEDQQIPVGFNYSVINGLRHEAYEKLTAIKPENIGQASRISGVSPADISIVSMWLKRFRE